ncbi:MAG: helix-turn-helix domain-containing protein [Kiritimatiellae bacterium]|nr:helix-turn-helix domain-containing protein [Kiritimatiellia bacterium]
MRKRTYQSIVRSATAYMQENLSRSLTVPELARAVSYSADHLRRAFREVVGEGVVARLRHLRMERAKQLLHETDLSVTDVAFEVGFGSYPRFAEAFRVGTGMSAKAWRRMVRGATEPTAAASTAGGGRARREWFREGFSGEGFRDVWDVHGEWRLEDGRVFGRGVGRIALQLQRPLPENFRLAFDARFVRVPRQESHHLLIDLSDEQRRRVYREWVIGACGNFVGELRRGGLVYHRDPRAVLTNSEWSRVVLEFQDDTVCLSLNGEDVFAFRDPFPPSYAERSHLTLGAWRSAVRLRDLAIYDLGFDSTVRSVRLGDGSFNSGLFGKARDFYVRLLQGGVSPENMMELRHKIGMCYVREGHWAQARAWLEKVVPVPGNDFWAQQAKLGMLETDWRQGDLAAFEQHARGLSGHRLLREGGRVIVAWACSDLGARGFHRDALRLCELLEELGSPDELPDLSLQLQIAAKHEVLREWAAAERRLQRVVKAPRIPEHTLSLALHNLAELYTHWGRAALARKTIGRLRTQTADPIVLGQCDLLEAANLRARSRLRQAIAVYDRIGRKWAEAVHLCAYAALQKALVLCQLGQTEQARDVIRDVHQEDARIAGMPPDIERMRRYCEYVAWCVDGEYERAAALLTDAARDDRQVLAVRAEAAVKAGILTELAGKPKAARTIWGRTVRAYPPPRCGYYGTLAERLRAGVAPGLAEMPYEAFRRSEMFFLVALLYESRGDSRLSRTLFRLCVKEDRSLRWPARLGTERLEAN